MRIKLSLLSVALFSAAAFGLPQLAHAGRLTNSEVYTFTGNCSDCVGTGTGTLTLTNYTAGDALELSNFVDFTYTSSIYTSPFEVTSLGVQHLSGSLGSTPGQYEVLFYDDSDHQFASRTGGFWCLGNDCLADQGATHTWAPATSPVPEPDTASLVGLGLAGAGLIRRRFQR